MILMIVWFLEFCVLVKDCFEEFVVFVVSFGLLVLVVDFGFLDWLCGWIVIGLIMLLVMVIWFLNLGLLIDVGIFIFDEKYYVF